MPVLLLLLLLMIYCCCCCCCCRDRLFEAGFDESVSLPWLQQELSTSDFARYGGVALIALLGTAGFAFGAIREVEAVKKLQVLDK
jgi:hypothetical protein